MSGTFDGYHVWLGIPPSEQPPNHYRLLGIVPFETDRDVIDHAADRQMAHVRTFQSGKHAGVSQKLLNELAAARLCLLNAEKKSAYDDQLRAKLSGVQKAVPIAAPVAKVAPVAAVVPKAAPLAASTATPVAKAEPLAASKVAPSGPKGTGVTKPAAGTATYESEAALEHDFLDDFGALPASTSNLPIRTGRRRYGRGNTWKGPVALGIFAGALVISLLLLYYVGRNLSIPREWKSFILEGPTSSSDSAPPSPGEEETRSEPPPAPAQ
jgi:hypothetical protein